MAFSDMTLYGSRGRWVLTEARPIEIFEPLRADLEKMSLGSYFAELLESVSDEDSPNPELLRLGLNALYALSRGMFPQRIIKADEEIPNPEILSLGLNALFALSEGKRKNALVKSAFELRLMCLAGFEPDVSACHVCGRSDVSSPRLDLSGGVVRCRDCRGEGNEGRVVPRNAGALDAMRYIVGCEPRKLFSFALGDETLSRLSAATEAFALTQLDRGFGTLEFYRSIKEE